MGGWSLLVYSYSFNQLKIKILITLLTTERKHDKKEIWKFCYERGRSGKIPSM